MSPYITNNQMNRYSNDVLNKINNSPYLKIVIPQNCCDRLNLLYLYSLSSINDESPNEMNETFLFKVDINYLYGYVKI